MSPDDLNHYTLLLPAPAFTLLLTAAREAASNTRVEGAPERWTSLSLTYADGATAKLTALERERPGDQFSRLILGAHNWAEKATGADAQATKARILRQIAETRLIVGVRTSGPAPLGPMRELARRAGGLLFDGVRLHDAADNTLERKTGP